jgi:hypothetical protein
MSYKSGKKVPGIVSRFLGTVCLVLLCIGASVSALGNGEGKEVTIEGMKNSIVLLTSSSNPNYLDAKLIGSVIAELRVASPTFRDVLAVLATSSRLLTLISPSTDVRYVDGMVGKTRFLVGPDRVVAFVDIFMDRTNTRTRQAAIAHELAHIAEVACLGPIDDQEGLRQILRRRADWYGMAAKGAVLETAFAIAAGRQVLQEATSRARLASQFMRLASESGLTACPVLRPNDGFTIVQRETPAAERGMDPGVDHP